MSNEHGEQAREIVLRVLRLRSDTELAGVYAEMVDATASALSSRDREVREVLEGLRVSRNCWCPEDEQDIGRTYIHFEECKAARALYEQVQGKEGN